MTIRYGILGLFIGIIALTLMTALGRPEPRYSDQVAVLMYHHIHDTDTSSSTITSKLFRDQLTLLQKKGFHFLTLEEYSKYLEGASVPDQAVLVTFDDGYESFYQNAYPILKELKVPAVNFVITGSLAHPQDDVPPKLSTGEIRKMVQESPQLVDFQCHTNAFHGKGDDGKALILPKAGETKEQYRARIQADTKACQAALTPLIGKPVYALAYPYGIYNGPTADALRQAGIRLAFTIEPKMTVRGADPMKLPRINAGSPNVTPQGLIATIEHRIVKVKPLF